MNAAKWGQIAVVVILFGFFYYKVIRWTANKLAEDAHRIEETERQRLERLKRHLRVADAFVAWPENEKQRLMREAEALGFLDPDDAPRPAA